MSTAATILASLLTGALALAGFSWLLWWALDDGPARLASRRRCVAHRGEIAAVLATADDHLCQECRDRLARIRALESAMDRPLPPPSMADPSLTKVIWR